MKARQLIRRLKAASVEIEERRGKGGHYLARYSGRQTAIPIHGDTEQLGLEANKVL